MPPDMPIELGVIGPEDADEAFEFAQSRLAAAIPDESERMLASWSAPWRREALDHYLGAGWCFSVREAAGPKQGRLCGFVMAQPFLFVRGQTQSLWVEHVEAESAEVAAALVDVAYRAAREKHIQRTLFADSTQIRASMPALKAEKTWADVWEIKTTKG